MGLPARCQHQARLRSNANYAWFVHFLDASLPLDTFKGPAKSRFARRPWRCGRGRYAPQSAFGVIVVLRRACVLVCAADASGWTQRPMGAAAGASLAILSPTPTPVVSFKTVSTAIALDTLDARPPPPRRAHTPSRASRTLLGALETPNSSKEKIDR